MDSRAPYIYAKTLSLYLKGWTQEAIAETDGKVVEVVSAGAQEEEIEKAREAARLSVLRILDRVQNEKILQMSTILKKENPDEETRAQQSIIKQYLGAHLLDPSQPPPSLNVSDVWNFSRLNVNGPIHVQLNDIAEAKVRAEEKGGWLKEQKRQE
jgi:hypothetical protein